MSFAFDRIITPAPLPPGFSDPTALLRVAEHLLAAGNSAAAVPALILCANHLPGNASVWVALGMGLAQEGQDTAAVRALRRGVALAPKRIDALCALGELHLRLMQFSAAAQALKAAVALDPQAAHPQGVRARALMDKLQRQLREEVS